MMKDLPKGLTGSTPSSGKKHSISLLATDPAAQLSELIGQLNLNTGEQVVVLVDEYDKPILDTVHNVDHANDIREVLHSFYTVLKASAAKLRFLFVTGITKGLDAALADGMKQRYDNHYYKPFLNQNKQVHLLALAFTQRKAVYTEEVVPL